MLQIFFHENLSFKFSFFSVVFLACIVSFFDFLFSSSFLPSFSFFPSLCVPSFSYQPSPSLLWPAVRQEFQPSEQLLEVFPPFLATNLQFYRNLPRISFAGRGRRPPCNDRFHGFPSSDYDSIQKVSRSTSLYLTCQKRDEGNLFEVTF